MTDDTLTKTTNADGNTPAAADTADAPPAPEAAAGPERNIADVVDLDAVRAAARGEGAAEAGLIAELCALAGMSGRTADMLARGIPADEARRGLLACKAGEDAEVRSHVLPGAGTNGPATLDDNPVVRAATARAAKAKEA